MGVLFPLRVVFGLIAGFIVPGMYPINDMYTLFHFVSLKWYINQAHILDSWPISNQKYFTPFHLFDSWLLITSVLLLLKANYI